MKLRDLIMLCLLSLSSFGVMAGVGKAADWPCEAVLCLSNLGGPTQYSQCVPPMTKLWECLANPSCVFPGCAQGGVSAKITHLPDYLCPTNALGNGAAVLDRARAVCLVRTSQGRVSRVTPRYNPYNLAVTVTWSGGGETVYVDQAHQSESIVDPRAARGVP
ncbi:MAG: hypothetical protein KGL26_13025 [Pseudomonadota bacterium]|nr:hypothetical protein [Pseudomonadota bacterium]